MGQDREPLTPALIAHLVKQGWSKAQLEQARADGAHYCRSRDRLVYPAHTATLHNLLKQR
jgi:hypothetical protein